MKTSKTIFAITKGDSFVDELGNLIGTDISRAAKFDTKEKALKFRAEELNDEDAFEYDIDTYEVNY